jgi:hypothetical protein
MTRRGLTLLEVVAATALLTIIPAACLPLLGEARRWAESTSGDDRFDALVQVADEVVVDPEAYGIDDDAMQTEGFSQEIVPIRDDGLVLGSVSVELFTSNTLGNTDSGNHENHGWLVFRLGSATTIRYIDLPDPPVESSEDTGA